MKRKYKSSAEVEAQVQNFELEPHSDEKIIEELPDHQWKAATQVTAQIVQGHSKIIAENEGGEEGAFNRTKSFKDLPNCSLLTGIG